MVKQWIELEKLLWREILLVLHGETMDRVRKTYVEGNGHFPVGHLCNPLLEFNKVLLKVSA